ncbi:FGGY-family carbohydrate kinase [Pelagibius litoralis]|uniref:FGGY-family carbohydrate kinase n=2 Tax=Pelagibius litoralis TaxID=374515 RepID=A0A967EUY0_9PROT|nr:FGGY-family carbohydrate kinase [Pelagibius litoralis]
MTKGQDEIVAQAQTPLPAPDAKDGAVRQDPHLWWEAVDRVLLELSEKAALETVVGLCVDGTSGTILVSDAAGEPLASARMYNDRSAVAAGERIDRVAAVDSMARGTGGSLARLLTLLEEVGDGKVAYALHQADWIAARLTGRFGRSDFNNCLKLGFDVAAERWPDWMSALGFDLSLLPRVAAPGTPLTVLLPAMARRYGLPPDCQVVHGTTDGNAAFLAAGAFEPGTAVTSLGSTLTLKLVSAAPVFAPDYGVYSHKLLGHWLAGGASNTGGAAIACHFSVAEIERLTPALRPEEPTGLEYYPLPSPGERFPVADPQKAPVETPRPEDDAIFLQGLLEGIAGIERDAYARLAELGATPLRQVLTVGGGAANAAWTQIRARVLGVPVTAAANTEAAYGAARLARFGCEGGA